jgi:geranylgeranyl pyrophosphate synthase
MLGAKREDSIALAAAVEMLHTATLVHDDLIDGSQIRRGIPTLNAQWDLGATVLTGDYIFARAAGLAAEIGSKRMMQIFAHTLMTIVNGEISQLFGATAENRQQAYYDRIYAKTASLFEVSTEGVAILSKSDEFVIDEMKSFGYNLGIAFQIVDDILDFVSDQDHLGKPVANDLRQGIITLPTLCYLEKSSDGKELYECLRQSEMDEQRLQDLIHDIRTSDSIDCALDQAKEYIARSEEILTKMPATPEREALSDLAQYIVERTA